MRYHFSCPNIVSAVLVFSVVFLLSIKTRKISREEATALAETYVRCNGYTNVPADTMNYKLAYEDYEMADGMAALLNERHNTMLVKAESAVPAHGGWYVVFEYTPAAQVAVIKYAHTPHKSGAVIFVDKYGTSIHRSCQDMILDGE